MSSPTVDGAVAQHRPSSQNPDAQSAATNVAMIARQAIVNSQGDVVGYELFNRSRLGPTHTAATDIAMVFSALSHAGTDELVGRKMIFVNCTHESLSGGHLELLDPDKVVLEIPPLGLVAAQEVHARRPILAGLRARGFHLAFGHTVLESTYAPWLELADYIKFDLSLLTPEQLAVMISYAQRHCKADLIAEKVETADQFERTQRMGIQLFQGYWFARPSLVQAKMVSPAQASVLELINLVRRQASTDEIEEVLKKDAGLAFNLMRLINSSGFGFNREITSFRQAVMLMGLKRLFRWAALLMTTSRAGGVPSSVGHTAVVRGRLVELLTLEKTANQEEADQAFVAGIFSLLDTMLSMPMESALALLNVPVSVEAALLRGEGLFGDLLRLAHACEEGDDGVFDQIARKLELTSQQINGAHLQALAWADHITDV